MPEQTPVQARIRRVERLQTRFGLIRKQVEATIADLKALGFLVDEDSELHGTQRHGDATGKF